MRISELKNINIYKLFIVLIIFAGIVLRISAFMHLRPFWLDECYLALNITDNDNYFSELIYNQAAPPFFMYLSKFFYNIIPFKAEFSLRLLPLLSGIGALFVFQILINKIFTNNLSKIMALSLFAFNFKLIYYSSEFKQYSSDVLIFLSVIAVFLVLKEMNTVQKCIYGLLMGAAIWFSNAAVVAIPCIALIYLIEKIKTKSFKINDILLFLPSLLSVIAYCIIFKSTLESDYLHNFWEKFFIAHNFSNIGYIIKNNARFFFTSHTLLLRYLILFGIFIFTFKKRFIIILPIFLTLLLSYLHICPTQGRIILYILPVLIICACGLLEYKSKFIQYPALIIMSFLIFCQANYAKEQFLNNELFYEDVLSPLQTVSQNMKGGDYLLIDSYNNGSFKYYNKFFKFDEAHVKVIPHEVSNFVKAIKTLPKGNYFFVFSHSAHKGQKVKTMYDLSNQLQDCKIQTYRNNNLLMTFTVK